MKLNRLLLLTLAGVAPVLAVRAAAPNSDKPARAEVVFLEPEKFTDVKGDANDTRDRNGYLEQLRTYIVTQAATFVPEGQKLAVTFTDVDLAGDYPPGRTGASADVRVIKEIYPPRLVISFRLTDATGAVVKQGKRELTNTAFMMNSSFTDRSDPLRYEKSLLNTWFHDEFRASEKTNR